MNEKIVRIANVIENCGGRLFLVGGAVRDEIRGVQPKDFDFVIVGLSEKRSQEIVSRVFGEPCVNVISNAPVFACGGDEFAMARVEKQVRGGKGGFEFESNPSVTLMDDLIRRDFTSGAIAKDVLTGEIIDPFNGISDIKNETLKHVFAESFVQSPERVFRGIAQAARFGWTIHHSTIELMEQMKKDFDLIPIEQIWLHFEKAGMQLNCESWRFSMFLSLSGWNEFFPEIKAVTASHALIKNGEEEENKVEWFIASLMAGMSLNERESFLDRINAPRAVRRVACEFEAFGGFKPQRWVEGRDISHVVPAGKEMGKFVNLCFIGQLNGQFTSKEDAIRWVENSVKKG